jgi:hypothetical protein
MSLPEFAFARLSLCVRMTLAVSLPAGMSPVWASNLNFLNDTPMSYVKQPDMQSIKTKLIEVLNNSKDGDTVRWSNEGTGNGVRIDATIQPESTSQEGGKTCRLVSVVLNAKGQSMNLHPKFCGTGKTDWALQKR